MRLRSSLGALVLIVAACASNGSPSPVASPAPATPPPTASAASPTPSPSASRPPASGSAQQLPTSGPLAAGSYTDASFSPSVTFEVADGWSVGSIADGFFDVQQLQGTPDVIAVQFGRVDGIVGAGKTVLQPKNATEAARTIDDNPGLLVIDESESQMSGLTGSNVVVENRSQAHAQVLRVPAGTLGIDSGRRLWISLFDTEDGVLAIMVGGSVAKWDAALRAAEPVLESVAIGEGR